MSNNASQSQEINKTFTSLLLNGGTDCAPTSVRHPDLDVYGGARIRKTLCADGELNVGEDLVVSGNLTVLGDTLLNDTITGNLTSDDINTETLTANTVTANCFNLTDINVETVTANIITGNSGCFDTLKVNNDLTVDGNITVNGNLTTIDTETIVIEDNKIVINNGELGSGVTAGTAGFEIDRGSLPNYLVCYDESKPGMVVGEVGNTQCVALIEDNPVDGELVFYNQATNQLESSGISMVGNVMVGNVCGEIKTQLINPVDSANVILINGNTSVAGKLTTQDLCVLGNVDLQMSSELDMGCGNISNVQSLFVDNISSKSGNGLFINSDICFDGNIKGNNNVVIGLEDLIDECIANNWTQRGEDIIGAAPGDSSGVSVSLATSGLTVAIGSRFHNNLRGHVRIFDWSGAAWVQRGLEIEGLADGDRAGGDQNVAISDDGNTVVIGSIGADPNGTVRIFDWSGAAWVQRGMTIIQPDIVDRLVDLGMFSIEVDGFVAIGWRVSISSDKNSVAIGGFNVFPDIGPVRQSTALIYDWSGGSWVQRGSGIDGYFNFPSAIPGRVEISNSGNTVIFADSDGITDGSNYRARIFDWSGAAWIQRGGEIFNRNMVSISDDANTVGVASASLAAVYDWLGAAWIQRGMDIPVTTVDNIIHRVSLSNDGNKFAIGEIRNSNPGGITQGSGRVFDWSGSSWVQRGMTVVGLTDYNLGWDISLSGDGNTFAAGAPSGGTPEIRGLVQVYDYNCLISGVDFLCSNITNLNSIYVSEIYPKDTANVTVNGGLNVNGSTTVNNLEVNNNILTNSLEVTEDATVNGNLTVQQKLTTQDLCVTGNLDLQMSSELNMGCGNISNVQSLFVDNISSKSGNVVSINQNTAITGNVVVTGDLMVSGNVSGGQLGLTIQDEGVPINASLETRVINFVGANVTTTSTGPDSVQVEVAVAGGVVGDNITSSDMSSSVEAQNGGNVVVTGMVDMNCGNISNIQAIFVDQMFGKNSPINVHDNFNIKDTASGGKITFEAGIEIGDGTTAASGDAEAVAIGKGATASGTDSIAFGFGATSGAADTIAFGKNTSAGGASAIAIGDTVNATQSDAIAIGRGTVAAGGAVALGVNSTANNLSAIAIGDNSTAGSSAVAIGHDASATSTDEVCIGTASPTNNSAQAKIWDGQVFQDRAWSMDGTVNMCVIDTAGDITKDFAGNVELSGNLVIGDTLFVGTIAGNSPVKFIDPIIAENLNTTKVYNITEHAIVSMYLGNSTGSFFNCSGFFVSSDGWLVTGSHCVQDTDITTKFDEANIYVTVTNVNGNAYTDVLQLVNGTLHVDGAGDIAVMKVAGITNQSFLEWGDSANIAKGAECYVVGNPLGVDHQSISKGVVRDNAWIDVNGFQPVESVMTDCDIYGGNSGGPIVDNDGKVIGILNFGYGEPSVLNGGVSQRIAQPVVNSMITNGVDFNDATFGKGWLGITGWSALDAGVLEFNGLVGTIPPEGIVITVEAGSPLANVGITSGSVILEIDDIPVGYLPGYTAPSSVTWTKNPGDTVEIKRWTGGAGYPAPRTSATTVTLGVFPTEYDEALNGGLSSEDKQIHLIKPIQSKKKITINV
jgi:S1-C subfamily serine protease